MAAVTQTINSYLGGVSRQTDKKKLPGQVRECLNAYPDPTFGLRKRPGFKFIKNLHTSSDPASPDFADAKWFFIKRSVTEQYIGCILDSDVESTNPIKIWNVAPNIDGVFTQGEGTACTVTYDSSTKDYIDTTRDNYDVLTVQDTTIITNRVKTVAASTAPTYVLNSTGRVIVKQVDYQSHYSIKVTPEGGSTYHTDTGANPPQAYVTKNDDSYVSGAVTFAKLNVDDILTELKTRLDALSISGHTLTTTKLDASLELELKTSVGTGYSVANDLATTGGSGSGLKVNVTSVDSGKVTGVAIHTAGTSYEVDDVVIINTAGANCGVKITAVNSGVPTALAVDAHISFEVQALDERGGANMIAYSQQVSVVSDLPAQSIHDKKIKVINSSSVADAYWTKFIADNTTYNADGTVDVAGSGKGFWQETRDPSVSTGMNPTTLPHELKSTALNTFKLQQGVWTGRNVGDTVTNSDPSFVGKTIQQTFFHNNRLGVLTGDNVSMSQSGDFFNFYYTSALTATDSDPIDINTSSIRPAVLHAVIPTAQGLILFSKHEQFIMFADAKILTPASAIIRGISNYEMDEDITPVDVGTNITFVSKTPSYTRVFNMITRGADESPMVEDIGKVVSEWIPDTVNNIVASPQNALVAMYGTEDTTMYMYKTYIVGDRRLMQAWVKWDFPGFIQHASIDSDTLWTIIQYDGKYVLASASLTQTPDEKIIVNSDGQQVNPHMDLYGAISSMSYDTTNKLTKCYLPTGMRDNATLTPVLVIAGDGTTNFAGVTESGFTITPDRPTGQTHATSTPYFEVPGEDLTNLTAADIIVGYKYNYDVELPKTYFKLSPEGNIVDYTASLIVSRMKFAVGLSSVCGFKLKVTGRQTPREEYTGVGTIISSTLVANGTGAGPQGDHTVENLATSTNGSGTGMTVNVAMSGGVATAVTVNTEGAGYANGNTVTIAKALLGGTTADVTATITTVGQTDFPFNLDYDDVTDLKVKINGVGNTGFSIVNDTNRNQKKLLRFTTPPGEGDTVLLYTDNWYTIQPVQDANQYLADDVPLTEETVFTLPIHQKSENFNVRVFSNSPFPVSLSSMMWEGQYSPRYYRRT